ncbi:MAG: type II toxin-antitoxin system ParD family antitoxin [Cypionkella sp.]
MGEMTFPPELQSWIAARVAEGRYIDQADYLRDLVRRDQDNAGLWEEDTARVRRLIEEGEASAVSDVDPFALIESLMAKHKSADA